MRSGRPHGLIPIHHPRNEVRKIPWSHSHSSSSEWGQEDPMVSFPFIILGMTSGRSHGLIPIHHPRNEDVHSHWSKFVPRKQSIQQTDKGRHSGNSCSSQWRTSFLLWFCVVHWCEECGEWAVSKWSHGLCSCTQLVDAYSSMLIDMWVGGGWMLM